MGTWFGTDALTQLAIRDGDKARLFFLLPRKGYRGEALGCGFSGSDELWAPVGAPLAGRYDGYGRIDRLERGFALDFMADWASRGFASGSLALSKDASPEKGERDDKSIENVVKWTERGWIEVRTLTGGGPLCGMLVLESVYRAAMAAAARIESFLCEGPYLEYVDGLAARFLATLGKKRTDDDAQTAREELWRFEHGNAVLRWGLAEFLGKKPLDPGTEAEARKLIVDHFAFKKFLDDARKTFAPQAGAGGHQDETWLQRALAEATIEVCDKRRRSRERDED